jgi:hypothetical protein
MRFILYEKTWVLRYWETFCGCVCLMIHFVWNSGLQKVLPESSPLTKPPDPASVSTKHVLCATHNLANPFHFSTADRSVPIPPTKRSQTGHRKQPCLIITQQTWERSTFSSIPGRGKALFLAITVPGPALGSTSTTQWVLGLEDGCLLGCWAVQSGKSLPTIQRS